MRSGAESRWVGVSHQFGPTPRNGLRTVPGPKPTAPTRMRSPRPIDLQSPDTPDSNAATKLM